MIRILYTWGTYSLLMGALMYLILTVLSMGQTVFNRVSDLMERHYLMFIVESDLKEVTGIQENANSDYTLTAGTQTIRYQIQNQRLKRVLNGSWTRYIYQSQIKSFDLSRGSSVIEMVICFSDTDCQTNVFWTPAL